MTRLNGARQPLTSERPEHELMGAKAAAAFESVLSPLMTARVNRIQFTVQCVHTPKVVGGTLIQKITLTSGDEVLFRIATNRVRQLVSAWARALETER